MNNQVSKNANIGDNVDIGLHTVIHDNVVIGDNTIIESHCVIGCPTKAAKGKPLVIQQNSCIRSHSIFYEGSTFGPNLVTGHSVLVRENCQAGKYFQIGSFSEIQGDCIIGDYVKFHSYVNVAKEANIGNLVWFFPRVQLTNDPFPPSSICLGVTIKDMAVIATAALLFPGITVGLGCVVGAGSVVTSDVPDIHCVRGNPAKIIATLDRLVNLKYNLSYPWPKHFREGYPEESFALIDTIVEKIKLLIEENHKKTRQSLTPLDS